MYGTWYDSRSYDFLFSNILNKIIQRKGDHHSSVQLCNGFQTARMFYLSCNFDNCEKKSKPKIVSSFTTKQKVLFKFIIWLVFVGDLTRTLIG